MEIINIWITIKALKENLEKEQENKVLSFTKNHYENFPVASFLIPKSLRKDIAIIYWFARTADDLADEGDDNYDERLEKLNLFEKEFNLSLETKSNNQFFEQLSKTIKNNNLTSAYFLNLLSAFKQDVIKKRYENFNEVLDYCNRSANPVGRILLELFKVNDEEAKIYSDKVCTALQLTNFYQDTLIDFNKDRIYYPEDEMKLFNVTKLMLELKENNPNIKELVKHNVDRTQFLFDDGKKLFEYLSGRFLYEIKWTIAGGEKILCKIRKNNYNVFSKRPKLSKIDFITLFMKSIF